MIRLLSLAVTAVISLMAVAMDKNACPAAPLRFVVPDIEIDPYVTGTGPELASPPGAAVELMQEMAQATCPSVVLRLPLVRARAYLSNGAVDALWLIEPTLEFQQQVALPRLVDGALDPSAAVPIAYYVYGVNGSIPVNANPMRWLQGKRIGMTYGAIIIEKLRATGLQIDDGAHDRQSALRMLLAGHIDAYIGFENMEQATRPLDDAAQLVRMKSPLLIAHAYLAFSKAFQTAYPRQVEAYWNWIREHGDHRLSELIKQYPN